MIVRRRQGKLYLRNFCLLPVTFIIIVTLEVNAPQFPNIKTGEGFFTHLLAPNESLKAATKQHKWQGEMVTYLSLKNTCMTKQRMCN